MKNASAVSATFTSRAQRMDLEYCSVFSGCVAFQTEFSARYCAQSIDGRVVVVVSPQSVGRRFRILNNVWVQRWELARGILDRAGWVVLYDGLGSKALEGYRLTQRDLADSGTPPDGWRSQQCRGSFRTRQRVPVG